jgi:DNA-binding FadR family transcriptional regulator
MSSDHDTIRRILTFIRERRYESGDRLPSERDFAERFNVSRGVVRKAISALVAVRVIEVRSTSGNYLKELSAEASFEAIVLENVVGLPLSPDEVSASIETRVVLEREAVRLACERVDEAGLAKIQAALDATERRLAEGKPINLEDTEFHLALAGASGNSVLVRLLNAFYVLSQERRHIYFETADHGRQSHAEHLEIFAAVSKRDAETAARLIARHVTRAYEYFSPKYDP